ncbi:Lsr2 family DNA-binding protein [Actinocrinis sp.]|uniref:Lsr2 family DNA-binding protein n=1 Tax=Actinocrinis sp. TaxID=1920516 RepID=UPI002D62ABCC|nr:histone-like nucleoid-structuring protein Lsr2 [Actinocrinis sp.]HZP51242.1 histone-like nucleoid-structuring protein Lsr2 [Actinocrinis sp.]
MALKRVCDITGTDHDVEICDVTIAGQTIKLDLSPAGADKLREFFGAAVTVQHPLASGAAAVAEPAAQVAEPAAAEADEEEQAAQVSAEEAEAEVESEAAPVAAERPSRRGRRAAGAKTAPRNAKGGGRKKAAPRRGAKPVTPGTSEIREWARANGFEIGERGAIPGRIRSAYTLAHE